MSPSSTTEGRSSVELTFRVPVEGREVPVALWLPTSRVPSPLVLVGHGGAGHKRADIVLELVRQLTEVHQIAVAAIDGPVHGERRTDGASATVARDEFRALWDAGGSVETMLADWRAVLAVLRDRAEINAAAVAYYGLSMGTAYGLPLLAAEPGIGPAVIGMWGTSRVHGDTLLDAARKTRGNTMFCIQWDDELFTRGGQFELFDAVASPHKQMAIHPGPHVAPTGDRLDDIVHFLVREITR